MNDKEVMKSGRMNERMNDRKIMEREWKMNEWLNKWTIYGYYEWQKLCVPCRMNEWTIYGYYEWEELCVSCRMNEWTIYGYYERQELWMNEWIAEWMCRVVSCRRDEWMNEWINYIWILWMTGTMCVV